MAAGARSQFRVWRNGLEFENLVDFGRDPPLTVGRNQQDACIHDHVAGEHQVRTGFIAKNRAWRATRLTEPAIRMESSADCTAPPTGAAKSTAEITEAAPAMITGRRGSSNGSERRIRTPGRAARTVPMAAPITIVSEVG